MDEGLSARIAESFLPTGPMLQLTRVISHDGGRIIGCVDLSPEHWVFGHHFPGDPVFPGSLLIEAAGQLVALAAWLGGHRGRPRLFRAGAEFRHPVSPATPLLVLASDVRRRRNLFFGAVSICDGATEVASVTVALAVLPGGES